MIDGVTHLMSAFQAFRQQGTWTRKRGDNIVDGGAPFYRSYETKDGKYVAVGAIEPHFYANLLSRAWGSSRRDLARSERSRAHGPRCASDSPPFSAPAPATNGSRRPPGATPASRRCCPSTKRRNIRRCGRAQRLFAVRRPAASEPRAAISSERPPRCGRPTPRARPEQPRSAARMGVRSEDDRRARGGGAMVADLIPMRLILVRHGRPDEDDADSPNDPPLNADGWRQARAARELADEAKASRASSPARCGARSRPRAAGRAARPADRHDRRLGGSRRRASRYRSTETLRAEGGEAWRTRSRISCGGRGGPRSSSPGASVTTGASRRCGRRAPSAGVCRRA